MFIIKLKEPFSLIKLNDQRAQQGTTYSLLVPQLMYLLTGKLPLANRSLKGFPFTNFRPYEVVLPNNDFVRHPI